MAEHLESSRVVGVDQTCRVLEAGIDDVLDRAGCSVDAVRAAVLGIAGIDREPQRSGVQGWLASALPTSLRLVVTDVELSLLSPSPLAA